MRAIGERLARWLDIPASSVRAIAAGDPGPAHAVVLRLERSSDERDSAVETPRDLEDETYTVDATPSHVVVRARHLAGLFYGAQTVAQLASSRPILAAPAAALAAHVVKASPSDGPPASVAPVATPEPTFAAPRPLRVVPCVHIEDGPAERVRTMHLDVARHFFDKAVVERTIDLLAFYKLNVFHWHLTDDQGFRLTIRSHPELTRIGGTRIEDGHAYAGSYTQDDVREVLAFAKERFITVIPEIEMPGHARAILAAHPELSCTGKKQEVPATWGIFEDVLCAGNPATFALLADILRETTELFPSRLVHLGGDEVPKKRWNECPKCRARMQHEHLDAEGLQGAFMKQAGQLLAARGRRMMAWDEALEGGLAKDGVVVAWQGAERGALAARAGYDVVLAPYPSTYFNFWQSRSRTEPGHSGYLPWTKVLAFDPVPPGLDATAAAHVLGGEGALWTEFVRTVDDLDTLLLPRLGALAEALWRPRPATPDGEALALATQTAAAEAAFTARFGSQRRLLDESGVRYFVEPPSGLRARQLFIGEGVLTLTRPALHPDGAIRFTLDGTDPDGTSPLYTQPVALHAATRVAARLVLPGGRSSDVVRGTFEPTTLLPSLPGPSAALSTGVLYTYVEGDYSAVPDFTKLVPLRSGRLPSVSLDSTFRPEHFAAEYHGFVAITQDGVYRFVAQADDGVIVAIDGVIVVVDDGAHAARESDGQVGLARGLHAVRVGYFQGTGGKTLALRCEGPSQPLAPCVLGLP